MATSRMSPPITSLEEMLQSPDYTLVLRPSGSVRDFFQSAPNNTLGKVLFIQNKQLLHIVPKFFIAIVLKIGYRKIFCYKIQR